MIRWSNTHHSQSSRDSNRGSLLINSVFPSLQTVVIAWAPCIAAINPYSILPDSVIDLMSWSPDADRGGRMKRCSQCLHPGVNRLV